MKSKLAIVLPFLLVTSYCANAQEAGRITSATAAEVKKSVLIQEDNKKQGAAVAGDSETRQATATNKNKRLQQTRNAMDSVVISDNEPVFIDSDYVATNELCTFNRAAYTYSCR